MKKTAVALIAILIFGSALACMPPRRRPAVSTTPKPIVHTIQVERSGDRLRLQTRDPSLSGVVLCDLEIVSHLRVARGRTSFFLTHLAGDWGTCEVLIGRASAPLSSYIPTAKALKKQERLLAEQARKADDERDRLLVEQDRKAREARDRVLTEQARKAQLARDAADAKKALWEKKHRFDDWGSFCEDFDPLRSDTCADEEDSYSREICMKGVRSYRKEGRAFKVRVGRTITYEPQKKRFKVVIRHRLGVFETEGDWDQCWRDQCYQSMLSTLRFRATSGKASYAKWVKRITAAFSPHLKPWKTFYVKEDQIENPERFDDDLVVEALVKFKDENWVYVGDWYGIENLQVKVVGLRARVGYEWGRVLVSARGQRLRTGCD